MIKVSYMLGLQHYAGSTKYVIIAQHVLWFIYFLYSLILLSFYYFNFARWISPFSLHACSAISNFISRRFSSSLTFRRRLVSLLYSLQKPHGTLYIPSYSHLMTAYFCSFIYENCNYFWILSILYRFADSMNLFQRPIALYGWWGGKFK